MLKRVNDVRTTILAGLFCLISILLSAAPVPEHVTAKVIADVASVSPGEPFRLGVLFKIDPQWHIYGPPRTEVGLPTEVAFTLPPNFTVNSVQYPKPKKFVDLGFVSYGYENEVLLFAIVQPPADLKAGSTIDLTANAKYLVCKVDGQCIPGEVELKASLPIGETKPSEFASLFYQYAKQVDLTATQPPVESSKPTASSRPVEKDNGQVFSFLSSKPSPPGHSLPLMLLFAFLGGLILNVMPCVLPVLSIKILSFVRQAGEQRARTLFLGLVFAAGVFVSFAVLAALVIALKGAGEELGWGFQFREPRFLIAMCAILLAFGLSFFGVYEFSLPGPALKGAASLQTKEGPLGSFFAGVLATALATPCTAPMLGPALGFAFTQSPFIILVFFFAIALGLASPYVVLAAFPQYLSFLPKPGRWMETFKQFMGFLLLATIIWLLWLFGKTSGGAEGIVAVLEFLLGVALACWLVGRGFGYTSTTRRRAAYATVATLVIIAAYMAFPERHLRWLKASGATTAIINPESRWEPFSTQRVEELVAQNRTVFVDFTADWCTTCKYNETAVLATASIRKAFADHNIALLKADYTSQPPEMTRVIRWFGRAGVPLYVIFPAGNPQQPIVLPELLTPSLVNDAISRIAAPR